jgi:hypothetical protein
MKLRSFCQGLDALRAENFVNPLTFFQNSHALQVRPEGPVRSMLRMASIMSKGGGFTAGCALCHF